MYSRPIGQTLRCRLSEVPQRIQILAGPRQVGKTTLIQQLVEERAPASATYVSVDPSSSAGGQVLTDGVLAQSRPAGFGANWLNDQWQQATEAARKWLEQSVKRDPAEASLPYVLVIDEVQKLPNWSETVKGLWDANLASALPMHLVLLGSSPLLMQQGVSESLAGRFELTRMTHWTFEEMNEAFGFNLDQYIYFGGFPGSAVWIHDEARWRNYVVDSLIAPNIEKDILELTRVDQPALLKQLFEVGCSYSGQIVALDKVLGVLNSKGNTGTLTRYLDLLDRAGLLRGLLKYSDHEIRRRRSPPKFQVRNTALISALGAYTFEEARADRSYWGRLVESAVGAHLCNDADANVKVHYWREGSLEVDFVLSNSRQIVALEVKSGKAAGALPGLKEFSRRNRRCRALVIGSEELPVGEFLRYPVSHWFKQQ